MKLIVMNVELDKNVGQSIESFEKYNMYVIVDYVIKKA